MLREKVLVAAKERWKSEYADLSYVKDILDIKYDTRTVIAGTLYKD